jgi:ABC-type nickel/cobalt efflux system permease component RcnA
MITVPGAATAVDRDVANGSKLVPVSNAAIDEQAKMQERLKPPFTLLGLLMFMGLGALHAKGPGHGKSMVAAYLLGTKGRYWDAVRLGLIVTFTHTFTLYTLGLGIVFLTERLKLSASGQQALLNRSIFLITVISGFGLSLFGFALTAARFRSARRKDAQDAHDRAHALGLPHDHAHDHAHDHSHDHAPAKPVELKPAAGKRLALVAAAPAEVEPPSHGHSHGHDHDHGALSDEEHAALHAREAQMQISGWRDLLSLGVSSGIVPCPAGVVLIVASMSLPDQNTLKCFAYLNAFSFGLGSMLIAIAMTMVFTRNYLVNNFTSPRWAKLARWIPVGSAALIVLIGLAIAAEGWDPGYERTWAWAKTRFAASKSV